MYYKALRAAGVSGSYYNYHAEVSLWWAGEYLNIK